MISSKNEWSTLREVVVGSAINANWPTKDPGYLVEAKHTTWLETPPPSGPVPSHVVEQANIELEILCNTLRDYGATVRRPEPMDFVALDGMYNYCPRDRLIIAGDVIVDVNMMYPCRNQEIKALAGIISGARKVVQMPRNQGMVLDAANICRLGDTWLFLESSSGNKAAYNWLCEQFPDINIELCNFYAGVHIDSTITPLREGLVVLNGHRVTPENCPKVFDKWEKIYVHDIVPQNFYQYPYASKWIGLNMLSLDSKTVIVDAAQEELIFTMKYHGIDPIPLTLSHSRTLGGGFHCTTLDLWRQDD